MKLTQDQKYNIYYLLHAGFSQRSIAKHLGHSRGTISRYLEPKKITDGYMELVFDDGYKLYTANREKSLWKKLAIIGAIGFIAQVLINIFY